MTLSIGINAWNNARIVSEIFALSSIYRKILVIYWEKSEIYRGYISDMGTVEIIFDQTVDILSVF